MLPNFLTAALSCIALFFYTWSASVKHSPLILASRQFILIKIHLLPHIMFNKQCHIMNYAINTISSLRFF